MLPGQPRHLQQGAAGQGRPEIGATEGEWCAGLAPVSWPQPNAHTLGQGAFQFKVSWLPEFDIDQDVLRMTAHEQLGRLGRRQVRSIAVQCIEVLGILLGHGGER